MALDVSADNLRREIDDAVKLRNEVTDLSAETVKRLAGPDYRITWKPTEDQQQNYLHEMAANSVPQLFYSNPAVTFGCSTLPPDHPFVRSENIGLNQWIKQSRLKRALTKIALDVLVDFGVAMVTMDKMPGYDTAPAEYDPGQPGQPPPPLWPCVHRISPVRFFTDPQATDDDLFRFRGHIWIRDQQDLLDAKNADGSPKFDQAIVEGLTPDANLDKAQRKIIGEIGRHHVSRRQIVGYEIYVPETGMIYTLGVGLGVGSDGAQSFLRPPRQYYGPRRGPYVMFGVHLIPDQVYPVSPMALALGLIRELNAHAGQASADAAAAKRLVLVDSTNKQLVEAVQSGISGSVIGVPGLTKAGAMNLDIGGAIPEGLNHMARLREVLDRQTGLTETKRGNLTGVTAREIAEASAGSDTRTRFAQDMFRGEAGTGVVGVLEIVAEHIWESNQVRFDVAYDDPRTGERVYEQFVGGDPGIPGIPHVPFRKLQASVSIDPYSMEMVDQQVLQQRVQTATSTTLAVLQASRMYPELKVREILNDAYESLNIKDGASRYVDMGILAIERAKARAMFGLQPSGANQPPQPPQPGANAPPAGPPGGFSPGHDPSNPQPGGGEQLIPGTVPNIAGVSQAASAA